jgi:tRNA1(Val) A37 N6-methylase TrmN6
MEILSNGFTLDICPGGFPLSTDSIALSGFVKLPANARVLDLGSGCGTLGLLLCAKDPNCQVTGLELNAAAHETATKNIAANNLSHRLSSICADLRQFPCPLTGKFDVCISNPPYFAAGPASKLTTARREDQCTMEQLFAAAAKAVRYGGDFYLVHRPERLAQLCACASNAGLEPKRLCLLRHKADGPVSLILVQCRKGGKPGLLWQEEALHYNDGTPTDYYKALYKEE